MRFGKKAAKQNQPTKNILETDQSEVSEATWKGRGISFKERLFFSPENKYLNIFDTYMLIIIAYSCFTSAYYVAFSFPKTATLMILEHIVFGSYSLDIIINFMRLPQEGEVPAS